MNILFIMIKEIFPPTKCIIMFDSQSTQHSIIYKNRYFKQFNLISLDFETLKIKHNRTNDCTEVCTSTYISMRTFYRISTGQIKKYFKVDKTIYMSHIKCECISLLIYTHSGSMIRITIVVVSCIFTENVDKSLSLEIF